MLYWEEAKQGQWKLTSKTEQVIGMKHNNSSNLGVWKPLIYPIAHYNLLINWHMIGVCVCACLRVFVPMCDEKNDKPKKIPTKQFKAFTGTLIAARLCPCVCVHVTHNLLQN